MESLFITGVNPRHAAAVGVRLVIVYTRALAEADTRAFDVLNL